jgi:hypothetical protein
MLHPPPNDRRRLLHAALVLALPLPGLAATRSVPFRRLAVMDPPYEESYEVLIAMAPPIARGLIAKAITHVATEADASLKTEQLTAALDPAKTRLHERFVHALADALDDADAKLLLVPMDPAETEDDLFKQVRQKAPQADAVMLANVMGRVVALHGLDAYAPGVMVGIKCQPLRGGAPWLEAIFSAGFRGIDPRAEHLEVADMPQRFDNHRALLDQPDLARQALITGVEAVAAEVAKRLAA